MRNKIVQDIAKEVNPCSAYSIICDETILNHEQLSICISTNSGKVKIKDRFLHLLIYWTLLTKIYT